MEYFKEKIPLIDKNTFILREFEIAPVDYPKHIHPEYELIYITGCSGVRFIGDNLDNFSNGDLILVGPNLPHQWKTEHIKDKAIQIILQIHPDFLGNEFLQRNETTKLTNLLLNAQRGVQFLGNDKKLILEKFEKLKELSGLDSIIKLLEMFKIMSDTKEYKLLASPNYQVITNTGGDDRKSRAIRYLFVNYTEDIDLAWMANVANCSKTAFAHFFKKKTNKTFTTVLNELRVGYSCKLLAETNKSISEICYDSGYRNLSYYNRIFKKVKGCNPSEYRKAL